MGEGTAFPPEAADQLARDLWIAYNAHVLIFPAVRLTVDDWANLTESHRDRWRRMAEQILKP